MLKRYSALESNYFPGNYAQNGNIGIKFKECNNLNLKQIACWPTTLIQTESFFTNQLNLNNLPQFNQGIVHKEYSFWRVEPLKWWIIDKDLKLPDEFGTSLDMSHAFTGIEIKGDSSTLFLNRHLPIDLRNKNFPDLSSASTAIHHVSIKLFKISSNNYCLYIPRGFALSIWEILLETADQFGYEVLDR